MLEQYIFSGSLPENASTYVKREADKELYEGLKAGKFCYVLNSRQSGKSSLRVRTMQRLRDADVACVSIDLSSDSVQDATPEQWYVGLIDYFIESFDLDVELGKWWSKYQLLSPLSRFRKFIEEVLLVEVRENIIVFIDEIDSVLSFKFPTDDFFAFIRACHNQRVDNPEYNRLAFCLLGVASPSNLISDKNRTPFNIGQAIILKGFQLHEAEPLEKGLSPYFEDTRAVIKEILHWTGGQPFLTQKLCQFMVEESKTANPRTVEQIVKAKIIENWESQDFPEHLRTIRDRILRNEERAGYLLELYQQVRASGEITNNDSIEQSELMLSGLVVKGENKLRVLNPIYYQVFNQNWIDTELKKLRPYSEVFRAWVASGCSDESRLLRGNALFDAEEWAKDKNLTHQDKEFLAASRNKETQEEIAAQKKEAQLERERKDREAAEKRNLLLTEANIKAKRQIRNGSAILLLTLLAAVTLGIFATGEGNKALEAQQQFKNVKKQAEEQGKKVRESQQQVQSLQATANVAGREAQQASKKAQEERGKAQKAEQNAKDANKKVLEATKQAQNAKIDANNANQDAEKAKEKAKLEQKKAAQAEEKAQEGQRNANKSQIRANEANGKAIEAQQKAQEAQQEVGKLKDKLILAQKEVETVQQLSKLAGDLRDKNLTFESDEALRQAGLSFRVNNHNLKQALLLASIARAYKQLNNPKADAEIKKSLEELNKSQKESININQRVQIKILAKNIEGNILENKNDAKALNSYQEAFQIIQKYSRQKPTFYSNEINPFQQNQKEQILSANDIESGYRSLINLLIKNQNQEDLKTVRDSLKNHLYAGLKYSLEAKDLKAKNWEEADRKTDQLVLHIAKREKEGFLDTQSLEQFSCTELKEIDDYWKQYSNGHFGFSVQKDIYKETGNRLGLKPQDWNDKDTENYYNFARRVGWYNDKLEETEGRRQSSGGFMRYEDYIERIKDDPLNPTVRGGLPYGDTLGRVYPMEIPLRGLLIRDGFFSRVATCKL
ncbi:AAA-like domain-containing protein [Dulcicalothrix desertica]|uniref:AAA-like domain-containing protein n=1 Tax=Dulcicalothrix desertica TaxID=32056 RepID=UPI00119B1053|nr:AAA-like domain-containing protein [Dulcicalothrix desertica]TWH53981.1 Membrane protein involved in colicin uptake [Dulcicalothrix desertica PCC 7102]